MKKFLLITAASLIGAQFTLNANEEILFESDFAPGSQEDNQHYSEWPFDSQRAPAGWLSNAFNQRWGNDTGQAAADSNGYFGEAIRFTDDALDTEAWWMSEIFPTSGGLGYTAKFAFRGTTDPYNANNGQLDGNAHVFIRFYENGNFLSQHVQDIILDGEPIGENSLPVSEDFSEVLVSEPDANGWRTLTLEGMIPAEANGVDFWALAQNGDPGDPNDPTRFFGSFGIDNVSVAVSAPVFETVVASTTHTAIELEFMGEENRPYLIVSTPDMNTPKTDWDPAGELIIGAGEPARRFVSTRGNDRLFFRGGTD